MEVTAGSDKYLAVAESFKSAIAPDAEHYNLVYFLKNQINDDIVYIYRFEPDNARTLSLYHAHITVIVDSWNKLKGYARTDEKMSSDNSLNEDKSRQLAQTFIKQYAPELRDLKFQYVNNHKESFIDRDNNKKVLNGKLVKFREAKSGHYLWVILAPDGRVMEFDRDIVWSFFRGGRVNELWLRDEWFGKRVGKGER